MQAFFSKKEKFFSFLCLKPYKTYTAQEKTAMHRHDGWGLRFGFGGEAGEQLSGNLARIQIRRELDDLLQKLLGFTAIVGRKLCTGDPQGNGDLVKLLGIVLDQRLQRFDISLAVGQVLQTLFVEFSVEDHALFHRLAFLQRFQLLLQGKKLVHVRSGGFQIVLLFSAVAKVAYDGEAGEEGLFLILAGLNGKGGEQGNGVVKTALRTVGIGGVQTNRKRDARVLDRNLEQRLIVAQESFDIQMIIETGEQLTVHVERSQILGKDDAAVW